MKRISIGKGIGLTLLAIGALYGCEAKRSSNQANLVVNGDHTRMREGTILFLDATDRSGHNLGFYSQMVGGAPRRIGKAQFEIYPTKLIGHATESALSTIDETDDGFFYSEYINGELGRAEEVASYKLLNWRAGADSAYAIVTRDFRKDGFMVTMVDGRASWRIANNSWSGGTDSETAPFLHKWSPDGSVLLIGIKGADYMKAPPGYPDLTRKVLDDYKEDCLYLVRPKDRSVRRIGNGFAAVWDSNERIVVARYGALYHPSGALMLPSAVTELLDVRSGARTKIGTAMIPMAMMAGGDIIWLESDATESDLRLSVGRIGSLGSRRVITRLGSPYYTWPLVQAHGVLTPDSRDVVVID